nr:YtxH domain-containing protein [Pedobacter panaciterrae]
MNYEKLIRSAVQNRKDNSLTAFALLAGLAAGAAIAVLFAPRSGRESRKLLADKLNLEQQDHPYELKNESVDDLREITREHADQLQGPTGKRKDPTQIKVPSAGTTAWKKAIVE